jgi:hypothetical protein
MVGMPYLLLGTLGFLIYRGYRSAQKKAEQERALEQAIPPLMAAPRP